MKHFILALAILAAVGGPAAAQNLLANPGFESGTTGWTVCPATMYSCAFHAPNQHSGSYALCADGCCGYWADHTGGWQDVSGLDPGSTYEIGGWAKGCDDTPDTPEYPTDAMVGYGGACGAPPTTVIGKNSNCTYTQYATTISGVSSVRFYFYGEPHASWSNASVHWDDGFVSGCCEDASFVGDWVFYH